MIPGQIKTRKAGPLHVLVYSHARRRVWTLSVTELRRCGRKKERKKGKNRKTKKKEENRRNRADTLFSVIRSSVALMEIASAHFRAIHATRSALTWSDKIVRVLLIIHTHRRRHCNIARARRWKNCAGTHIRGFSPLSSLVEKMTRSLKK